jgi:uncharacterized protein
MNKILLATAGLACLCVTALAETTLPYSEVQVSFQGNGGVTLHGTLTVPAHPPDTRVPALVLVQGSGPTDRDGNQPPALMTNLLKQLAKAFAEHGIATLRFDKRGMYDNHADWPKDKTKWEEFCRWEHFVGDVVAAYKFLDSQSVVDAKYVGLAGHSEGGDLVLQAADVLKAEAHPPAALILLSTPGRRMDAVIADQLAGLLQKQGATAAEAKFYLDENTRITKAIAETGKVPADVPAGSAALYPAYLGAFLHSELAVDPAALAKTYAGPVLVVAGANDTQVPAQKDAGALDAALKTRAKDDHQMLVLPGTSHNLKVVKDDADPGFTGVVAPDALDKITTWAAEKLRKQ